jgi:homocysteine S-methyltransferase
MPAPQFIEGAYIFMNRKEFRQRVVASPLLLDGALGTVLHGRGVAIDHSFDVINLENPALVAEIHRGYIEAGADVIETNSFGANRFKLAAYGLADRVVEINSTAVAIARRVALGAFKPVLLAGSVGPLGVRLAPLGRVTRQQAEEAFAEQIGALVSPQVDFAGVDLLVIETQSDLGEMVAAIAAARRVAPDVPIVAMMTFTQDDRTVLGEMPASIAQTLLAQDVDAIGVNCSGGPAQILRLLQALRGEMPADFPIAVSPNAGFPEHSDGGRVWYPATPAYFADYARAFVQAGASLVGGCCGTTAEHIAAMRVALDTPSDEKVQLPAWETRQREAELGLAVSPDQPTHLAQSLAKGEFIVTVEMSPPRGSNPQRQLAAARMLKEAGATCVNMADNPLAKMRMSAWAAAYLVQERVGIEAILHFPTRGRNLLRIHGDLLAAHALGVRNLFVVMGDPTRIGDYPEAMDNFDIVSSGLIRLIKGQLNAGIDQAGQPIDQPTHFVVGCAVNLNPKDKMKEMKLLRKKILNGADFALTQPIFDPQGARQFLADYTAEFGDEAGLIPIIAGIKPLFNSRNAEFLHHEVPGIDIPDVYRERMKGAENPQAEGVVIAKALIAEVRDVVGGVYLMPAFGRYDLVADIIDGL